MRFTTLIALFGVVAASENQDIQAIAKQQQQAVKGDMVALITLLDTIEMKNAPVMRAAPLIFFQAGRLTGSPRTRTNLPPKQPSEHPL